MGGLNRRDSSPRLAFVVKLSDKAALKGIFEIQFGDVGRSLQLHHPSRQNAAGAVSRSVLGWNVGYLTMRRANCLHSGQRAPSAQMIAVRSFSDELPLSGRRDDIDMFRASEF
jgi:hypothetical protein